MARSLVGAETRVAARGVDSLPARYALVDVEAVVSSVEIVVDFTLRVRRGRGLRYGIANPRAYLDRRGEQAAALLVERCKTMQPLLLLDPTRQAALGPPVVVRRGSGDDETFVVVAGNGRAAMLKAAAVAHTKATVRGGEVRAIRTRWADYEQAIGDELTRYQGIFGVPANALSARAGQWILVRIIDEGRTGADAVTSDMLSQFTAQSDQPLATAYDFVALADVRRQRLAKNKPCCTVLIDGLRAAMTSAVSASPSAQAMLTLRSAAKDKQREIRAQSLGRALRDWLASSQGRHWLDVLCAANVIEPESAPLFVHPQSRQLTTSARQQLTHLIFALAFGDVELIEKYTDDTIVAKLQDGLIALLAWPHTRAHERWRYFLRVALDEVLGSPEWAHVIATQGNLLPTEKQLAHAEQIRHLNGRELTMKEMHEAGLHGGAVEQFFLWQLLDERASLAERIALVGALLKKTVEEGIDDTDDAALLKHITEQGQRRFAGPGKVPMGEMDDSVQQAIKALCQQTADAARAEVMSVVTDSQWAEVSGVIVRARNTTPGKEGYGRPSVDHRLVLSAFLWLRGNRVETRRISRYWNAMRRALNRPVAGVLPTKLAGAETLRTLLHEWQAHKKWDSVRRALKLDIIEGLEAEAGNASATTNERKSQEGSTEVPRAD